MNRKNDENFFGSVAFESEEKEDRKFLPFPVMLILAAFLVCGVAWSIDYTKNTDRLIEKTNQLNIDRSQ